MPTPGPTLSEADSKALLRAHGVPVVDDREVHDAEAAVAAADALGYPIVVKLCGESIAHKTERGLVRDPQLGLNVMCGVGGILAEAVGDAVFCPVPLTRVDAEDLIDALGTQALLGPFRGEPAVDRERLADVLVGLSALATARPDVASVDVNPLIVVDGVPLAVDALVELVR